mgnify:CR=1 FL=1
MTSDFSGVDYYENKGGLNFSLSTKSEFKEDKLFGMAHLIFDFDHDKKMDYLFIALPSQIIRDVLSLIDLKNMHQEIIIGSIVIIAVGIDRLKHLKRA